MTSLGATNVAASPARADELDEVRRLRTEGSAALEQWRGGDAVRGALGELPEPHDPDSAVLVGHIGTVVVGYAVLLRVDDRAVLTELFCEPAARGVGVGHALLDLATSTASDWGCRAVDSQALPGDRATKNFFEAHGMVSRLIIVSRPLDPSS